MLVNDDGYVFVGQRLDNNQNAWQMPQGGIDGNEDPETAAYRLSLIHISEPTRLV